MLFWISLPAAYLKADTNPEIPHPWADWRRSCLMGLVSLQFSEYPIYSIEIDTQRKADEVDDHKLLWMTVLFLPQYSTLFHVSITYIT